MTRRNSDHVVMGPGDNQAECRHCGAIQTFPMPIPVNVLVLWIKTFTRDHTNCPPNTKENKC